MKSLLWRRRALLLLIPAVLLSALLAIRKFQQLQEPISVSYGPEEIQSRVLFQRMAKEAREHPYARAIYVGWSQPWPKESGLNISNNEGLDYNRRGGTLEHSILDSGWAYSHVEISGIELLARSNLPSHPTGLSPSLDAQLRHLGWIPE